MAGGTDGGGVDFDALMAAGRSLDAARQLQGMLPSESNDFAAELQTWLLDQADLERVPSAQRQDQWTRDQRRLRNRLMALRDAIAARMRGRAEAALRLVSDPDAPAPPTASGSAAPPPSGGPEKVRPPAPPAGRVADGAGPVRAASAANAPSVFISFSHCDRETAEAVQSALTALGIRVRIDSEIRPGDSFEDYIARGIRETDCTLCILSKDSLASDWVALETTLALSAGNWDIPRRLVGGYLDESFRDPAFQNQAVDAIDARIARVNTAVAGALRRRTDIGSYSVELERLHGLRANLDKALKYFRGTLCLDLAPASRQASVARLAASLMPPARAR